MKTRFGKSTDFFFKSLLLPIFLLFVSTAQGQSLSVDYLSYIETYKEIAVRQQQEYGIPASITLAQGLLESGAGMSRLASEGNNHFGIKCHKSWKGEGIYADDDEKNECFRKYANAEESFEDHARFLKQKRYAPLFELEETDYAADVTLTATLPEDGTAALEQALRDATSANADMEIMDTQFMGRRIK